MTRRSLLAWYCLFCIPPPPPFLVRMVVVRQKQFIAPRGGCHVRNSSVCGSKDGGFRSHSKRKYVPTTSSTACSCQGERGTKRVARAHTENIARNCTQSDASSWFQNIQTLWNFTGICWQRMMYVHHHRTMSISRKAARAHYPWLEKFLHQALQALTIRQAACHLVLHKRVWYHTRQTETHIAFRDSKRYWRRKHRRREQEQDGHAQGMGSESWVVTVKTVLPACWPRVLGLDNDPSKKSLWGREAGKRISKWAAVVPSDSIYPAI